VLSEQITGVRMVRAFVPDPAAAVRFDAANADHYGAASSPVAGVQHVERRGPVVCVPRIDSGSLQIGALVAFLSYPIQILRGHDADVYLGDDPRAAVCAERIVEVPDTSSSVVPRTAPADDGRWITS